MASRRRWRKWLLVVLVALIALLTTAYLTRRLLFEDWIAAEIETVLADRLGARVEIGTIGGNWLTSIELEDVSIEGGEGSAYTSVDGLRLSADFSPITLASGDLDGLRSARVTARRVVLHLDRPFLQPDATPAADPAPGPAPTLSELLRMLGGGASVRIDELVLAPRYLPAAPLHLEIPAAPGAAGAAGRTAELTYGAVHAKAHIDPSGGFALEASGAGIDRVLRVLGFDLREGSGAAASPGEDETGGAGGVEDPGRLTASLEGRLDPFALHLELEAGSAVGGVTPIDARIVADYADDRLSVAEVAVQVPGVTLTGGGIDLPLRASEGSDWLTTVREQASGELALVVDDLSAYRSLLPPPVQGLMPIRGRLALAVDDGTVALQPSRFLGRGATLALTRGSISLTDPAWESPGNGRISRLAGSGIAFDLEITEPFGIAIEEQGMLTLLGSLHAEMSGSLTEPDARAQLRLRDIRFRDATVRQFSADLAFDGRRLELETLAITGASRSGAPTDLSVAGEATLRLAATPAERPRLTFDLHGELPPALARLAGIEESWIEKIAPTRFGIRADLDFRPSGTVRLDLPEILIAGMTPMELHSAVSLAPAGTLSIEECRLRGEDLLLEVSGEVGEDRGRLRANLELPDLAVWSTFFDMPALEGAGQALVELDGPWPTTLPGPHVTIATSARIEAYDPAWLPATLPRQQLPAAPIRIDLQAAGDTSAAVIQSLALRWGAPAERRIALDAAGPLPLRWHDGALHARDTDAPLGIDLEVISTGILPDRPTVELRTRIEVDAGGLRIPTLVAHAGDGHVRGEDLVLSTPLEGLLHGPPDLGTLAIAGSVDIDDYDLGGLVRRMLAPIEVEGFADGQVEFAGTILQPQLRGELRLERGRLKHPDAPALEAIELRSDFSQSHIEIHNTAQIGGEPAFHVDATIDSGTANLWQDDAPLEGSLKLHEIDLAMIPTPLIGLFGPRDLRELQGRVSLNGTLAGTFGAPIPDLRLDIVDGGWRLGDAPPVQALEVHLQISAQQVTISDIRAQVDGVPLSVDGQFRVEEGTLWDGFADPGAAARIPIAGNLSFSDVPLRALPRAMLGAEDLSGVLSGELELAGTFAEPRPEVSLDLRDASLKFPAIPRLAELTASLRADTGKTTLTVVAQMGAAPVRMEAQLEPGEGSFPANYMNPRINARISGKEVLLQRSGGLKVRGDLDLRADGDLSRLEITGSALLAKSKFVKRLSLVPDLKLKSAAAGGNTFGPWSLPGGQNIVCDVEIKTKEPFVVRSNVIDTDLDVSCFLRGQGSALHLEGVCSGRSGTLRFPGMSLELRSLRLNFPQANPTRPTVLATAIGQRHGIRVNLTVKGPWDDPTVTLSSNPALQPKELWSLVTTGLRPRSLAENDATSNTAILATYVLQELLLTYFASESTETKESFVSRFTFEFGAEISRNGQETWQVDFDIGEIWEIPENFGVQLERDVYEDINMGLVYRWRF